MTGFGHDPYDAEWESPNTGRTTYKPGEDDDYCEVCDGDIVTAADGTQTCKCDEADEDTAAERRGDAEAGR